MSELALKLIKEAKEKRLTRLDLGNCGLTELPDELFELVWLEELILGFDFHGNIFSSQFLLGLDLRNKGGTNNIIRLNPKIQKLIMLKKIVIGFDDGDSITNILIPSILNDINYLKYLTKLQHLSLWCTQVSDLSPLKDLINLQYLNISTTRVSDLSPLKDLVSLIKINLSFTDVHNVMPLKNLVNLKEIRLSNSKITNIKSLKNLQNLSYLNISDTNTTDISPLKDIIKKGVKVGKDIVITNCPLNNPPRHIIKQGNEAILRYWQELENKETQTNNQTKLIFIGNSRAGKTSLWQFLKDKIYNDQADSTHGIKTEIWDTETLGTEDNQHLAAHIWDFGGQEYYHATHRLFLADNAVYVLVWEKDSNKQGTRFEKFKLDDDPHGEIEEVELEHFPASYWLENIQYFAGKHCPVLIVQNKVDEEHLKANYTEGVQEVNDCFHLSVQNAFGFQEGNATLKRHDIKFQDFKERLLELLRKNATAFKLVKYYAQVREALEAKAKETEYIAVSELKNIALQFDATPDLQNLLAYLKSFTNTVLYFQENPKLNDRLYLNPTHISRDIYKILNKTVRENNGKFDLAHIKTRLNLNDDKEAERFVALMREFNLIFEKSKTIKGETQRQFITPQYLPKKEDLSDDIQFLIEGYSFETAFTIQFKSFVPRSLMLRFIANNGALSNQETYWRNGIIYKSPTTQSMIKVEYDHDQSTFTIQVQDKAKQIIDMQNIVEQFVKLENSDENIKISNDGKLYVDLRTIRKLQHENRQEDIYTDGNIISLKEYNWLISKQKTEVSMTLEELKNQVRTFIGKAKTKDAMDSVATWAHENNQEQLKDDINLLKGEWATLNRNTTLGLVSHSEAVTQQNQLNNKVLSLLNSYQQIGSSESKEDDSMNEFDLNELDIKVIKAIGSFSFEPQDRLVMERSGLIYNEFQVSLANLKSQEIAYIFSDGNQRKIKTLANFHKAHRLIKKEEKEILKVHHNTKPAIYFSYAWGDDDETGESREKIVQELYESLKMDGYNVVRDKEDVGYKGSISDFMKTIGKGNSIIIAISDKYLKSENCMFEMYEIFRNTKLEKEGFIEKIYPIRIESIRLSDPLVLDIYFDHWEKKEKDWEQLIVKRGTRISSEQQEQYRRIKAIAHELGDFLAFLNDINAKTKADLSKNNFEEIKKAITKRVNF